MHQVTAITAPAPNVPFKLFNPLLPPVSTDRTTKLQFTVREVPLRIADDAIVSAWTFDGDIPGPVVHVKQGDTVDFTLVNDGTIPHSMDFHAAMVSPQDKYRSVAPGQTIEFEFTVNYPGVFMYHCGTSPVLMHIGSGMVGAIIVDPPRAGLAGKALKRLGEIGARRIVYVSCNPTTLAGDVKRLRSEYGYDLRRVKPVDMFPHTPHVESVSLLELA